MPLTNLWSAIKADNELACDEAIPHTYSWVSELRANFEGYIG